MILDSLPAIINQAVAASMLARRALSGSLTIVIDHPAQLKPCRCGHVPHTWRARVAGRHAVEARS